MSHEPAPRFWLHYAEREGALVEDAGDQALAVLPEPLKEAVRLSEEVSVTSDPDVAREDGAVLLIPGHPALERAATAAPAWRCPSRPSACSATAPGCASPTRLRLRR